MNFNSLVESIIEPSYKDTKFKVLKKKWFSSVDGLAHDEPIKFDDCPLYIIKDSKNSYWEYVQPIPGESFVQENMIHKKPQWFWKLRRELSKKGPRNQYLRHSGVGKEYFDYLEDLESNVFPKLTINWESQQKAMKAGASAEQARVISNI